MTLAQKAPHFRYYFGWWGLTVFHTALYIHIKGHLSAEYTMRDGCKNNSDDVGSSAILFNLAVPLDGV